jgi:peptidoglycan hydrolase-like protein with peptidoglycan-binding domain
VRNLQRDLGRLRFYSGPISGVYTPATRAAVIRFQKAKHLVPDGEWGVKSQAALDKALGRKPSAPAAKLAPLGWVRNLQRDLGRLRLYAGPVDGRYTPATRGAVIRFQRAEHLAPDGEWGAKSQAALDKALHRNG